MSKEEILERYSRVTEAMDRHLPQICDALRALLSAIPDTGAEREGAAYVMASTAIGLLRHHADADSVEGFLTGALNEPFALSPDGTAYVPRRGGEAQQ